MRLSNTAAVVGLLAALGLLGASACASTTVGVGWGVSVAGPYGPYGPYGAGVGPTVGVYGRPY
jgi:hypothetical protein